MGLREHQREPRPVRCRQDMKLHGALERWALPTATLQVAEKAWALAVATALCPRMVITDCYTQGLWFRGVLTRKESIGWGARSEEVTPGRRVSGGQSSLSLCGQQSHGWTAAAGGICGHRTLGWEAGTWGPDHLSGHPCIGQVLLLASLVPSA